MATHKHVSGWTLAGGIVRCLCVMSVLGLLAALAGCATIVDGGPGTVSIQSTPSGASVTVQDKSGRSVATGHTPFRAQLDRGSGYFSSAKYTVVVEKEGYAPCQERIEGELNAGWYLGGNLFFGGLIGWFIVDPISGAMWDLSRDRIHVNLSKKAGFTPPPEPPPPVEKVKCRKCEHENLKTAKFCVKCGEKLLAPGVCEKCGHGNRAAAKFCVKCGAKLQ